MDSETGSLSAAAVAGTGIVFALPARNASNVVLEGDNTSDCVKGICDYYSLTLATQPTTPRVTVTIAPIDGFVVLSSTDSRFSTVTPQFGTTAGVYQVGFAQADFNTPVAGQAPPRDL